MSTGETMGMRPERRVDCHAHIIDPGRFAYAEGRGYKPRPDETGLREAFASVLDAQGVGHALLVQPSCYGTDNSAMLDALANAPERYKAIAVVDPAVGDDALDALGARGVVGVRFNLVSYDPAALADAASAGLLQRLQRRGWFSQVYADDGQWPDAAALLLPSGVQILVDHFGVRDPAGGIGQPGFQAVLAIGRSGRGAVKISAPFRLSRQPDFADLAPYTAALIGAFGEERCVWGSDWPFLDVRGAIDYRGALDAFSRIMPDARLRRRILWDNPVRLFGFKG